MSGPKETPLVDLLRIVPIDAVGKWDTGPFETSSTPYGSLCHRAADEIQRLNAAAPAGEPPAPTAKPALRLAAERLLDEVRLFVESSQFADDIALVAQFTLSTANAAPANLSAALRAIVRECQDPKRFTNLAMSYLPPHLLDLAVAALESNETQKHETPLQVIEAMQRDERAPSYEELRERHREKRL